MLSTNCEKNMKSSLSLLLLAALAVLAACQDSTTMPEDPPDPLEILYTSPSSDSLFLAEDDSLTFVLHAQGAGPVSVEAQLEGVHLCEMDSFTLRAWEHVDAQAGSPDDFLTLEIAVNDSLESMSHSWELKILWGFTHFPEDTQLVNVLGQTLVFQLDIEAGNLETEFEFFVDGQPAESTDGFFYFHALTVGLYEVRGVLRAGGLEWEHEWTVEVQPDEPVDPPETVSDLRAGPGSDAGRLAIAFYPPEEGLREPVHSFEIRAFPYLIDDEQWESAYLVGIMEKTPGADEERYDVDGLEAGLELYVRVRSVGVSGNTSDWCEAVLGRVAGYTVHGQVIDFESGDPIEGLTVQYDGVISLTGPDGLFHCDDVPLYEEGGAWDFPGTYYDEHGSDLGDWFDLLDSRAVEDSVEYMMGTFSPHPFDSESYDDFLAYFFHILRPPPTNFHLIRPEFPITTYIPPHENEGLDYVPVIIDALDTWEASSGLDIYVRVDDPETAVLNFAYDDTMTINGITTILEWNMDTLTPIKMAIILAGDATPEYEDGLFQVVLHEFGHAIGFWVHSNDPDHCMNKTNRRYDPHPDELRLVRIIYNMETYQDLGFLLHN